MKTVFSRTLVCALLCALASASFAQDTRSLQDEYEQLVHKGDDIVALGTDAFGDKTAMYSGTTTFSVVDVSLPGNSALPVEFRRRFAVEDRQQDGYLGALANWEIDVPFMRGTFAAASGWQVNTSTPNNRCSLSMNDGGEPPSAPQTQGAFPSVSFWHGNFLHTPEEGDQELLQRSASSPVGPTDGATYPWLTKNFWFLSCIPSLDNAAGEGFVAISPKGVKYVFNHQIVRQASTVVGSKVTGTPSYTPTVARNTVYLMATSMTDRFGNSVSFVYGDSSHPDHLTSITSNDGRIITIAYEPASNRVTSVSTGNSPNISTWNYQYQTIVDQVWLHAVTLPDSSNWTYSNSGGNLRMYHRYEQQATPATETCTPDEIDTDSTAPFYYAVKHPAGATASFVFTPTRHRRELTPPKSINCQPQKGTWGFYYYPFSFDTFALTQKQVTGAGFANLTWTYQFEDVPGDDFRCDFSDTGDTCAQHNVNSLTDPEGNVTYSTFGNGYQTTEGQLQSVEVVGADGSDKLTTYMYVAQDISSTTSAYAFPNLMGRNNQVRGDILNSAALRPQMQREIDQDGMIFLQTIDDFDQYVNPLTIERASEVPVGSRLKTAFTKTDLYTYENNAPIWVLGQEKTHSDQGTGIQISSTVYTSNLAQPQDIYAYGKRSRSQTYAADGTLNTVTDGNSNQYILSSYKRGIAQKIQLPIVDAATYSISAIVDNLGHLTSVTDELGNSTSYGYDLMGRLSSITYPTGDDVGWNTTSLAFAPLALSAYGLSPGASWMQTVKTGTDVKDTYFDALWRPILRTEYDSSNATKKSDTQRTTVKAYDSAGRTVYESYPVSDVAFYTSRPSGTRTSYDGLGRFSHSDADSELSTLTRTSVYSLNSRTDTDALLNETTTHFQVFDEPSFDVPVEIDAPETMTTGIVRDVFGKPLSVARSGTSPSAVSSVRSYVYNANQLLCKTIDPESGATVQDYDGASNVWWTANGLNLPSPSSCDLTDSSVAGAKSNRNYDTLERLKTITYADGSPQIAHTYYPDGKLKTTTSGGNGINDTVIWTYGYDKRRLQTSETLTVASQNSSYGFIYSYDANGHLSGLQYPDLIQVNYAPDALGQPTQVGGYASLIKFYPNGAIHSFNYGNGISHDLEQNARGLPGTSTDTGVINDTYVYDKNANVKSITDNNQPSISSRSMSYDGVNRLLSATAPGLWGTAAYTYDGLDNILTSTVGTRSYTHVYNATTNRLQSLNVSGTPSVNYSYDVRGNLSYRDSQHFVFDQANRMSSTSGAAPDHSNNENYVYDGDGRRTLVTRGIDGSVRTVVYGSSGQLRFELDSKNGNMTDYIYLGHSLIAREDSTSATLAAPTVTAPPTNTTGTYAVSWTAVSGAGWYVLQQNPLGLGWVNIYSGPAATTTLTFQSNGSYQYQAQACVSAGQGCSNFGNIATTVVSGVAQPAAPAAISVSPSISNTGSYTVTWSAVSGATIYQLQENANSAGWVSAYSGASTSFAVAGKPNGSYQYQVRACSSACSGFVGPTTATVQLGNVPPPPTLTLTPPSSNNGNYSVSWTTVSGATSFQLEEQAGTSWNQKYSGSATSFAFSGRASGTYPYHVRSCNANGCGNYSAVATETVGLVIPLPPASISVPATSTTGNFQVTWAPSTSATQYTLKQQLNNGTWSTVYTGPAAFYDIVGLANGSYTYQVSACNGPTLCSGFTTSTAVAVQIVAVPAAPTITAPTGTNTTGSYTVVWGAVTGATSYQLNEKANGGTFMLVYSGASLTFPATHATGIYTYQVRACNVAGCGDYSANFLVAVSIPSVPIVPLNFSGPGQSATGNFQLTWTASSGATSYQVDQQFNSGAWSNVYNSSATAFNATGRAPGTYGYRAKACNSAGCSAYTATLTVFVQTPPSPPTLTVPANSSTGNFAVSWTAVTGAQAYQLDEQFNGGAWTQIFADASRVDNVTGRGNGTYGYRVRSCAVICGANSPTSTVTVVIGTIVPVPTGLTGPSGNLPSPANYTIQWNAVAGVTGYTLQEVSGCNSTVTNFTVTATTWSPTPFRSVQCNGTAFSSMNYVYRVEACINANCSSLSSPFIVTVIKNTPGGGKSPPPGGGTSGTTGGTAIVTYLHTDGLGSPTGTSNISGVVVGARSFYEPYGAPTSGIYVDGPGFTGHATDSASKLSYMQARYYDPIAGRFLSVDPIATSPVTAWNFSRYNYAANNPFKYIDPDGRCIEDFCIGEAALVGAIISGAGATYFGWRIVKDSHDDQPSIPPIMHNGPVGEAPPLPKGFVGEPDSKSGMRGGRQNSGKLAPEHGGSGDAAKDFDKLTGGKYGPPDPGKRYEPGTQEGDNGIALRPQAGKDGPRIDIPANGDKPHETLHYPPKPQSPPEEKPNPDD